MNSCIKNYWNSEYIKESWIYGLEPTILAKNIVESCKCKIPLKILDIGCGYGRDTIYYAQNGFVASGIDISNTAIKQARILAERNKTKVNYLVGDFLKSRFKKKLLI
ncbi:MAG: class I SAM-dependent methyltransferase [Flavobacteriaceae bacterium]|nr:class I SAM-dependent methyltransferase [Flavobacteriaceae bacterium]